MYSKGKMVLFIAKQIKNDKSSVSSVSNFVKFECCEYLNIELACLKCQMFFLKPFNNRSAMINAQTATLFHGNNNYVITALTGTLTPI